VALVRVQCGLLRQIVFRDGKGADFGFWRQKQGGGAGGGGDRGSDEAVVNGASRRACDANAARVLGGLASYYGQPGTGFAQRWWTPLERFVMPARSLHGSDQRRRQKWLLDDPGIPLRFLRGGLNA